MDGSIEISSLLQWILLSFIGANVLLVITFLIQNAVENYGGDDAHPA